MHDSDDATRLAIELRMRLSDLAHPVDKSAENELHQTVARYTAALRTLGMKPEAAVAAVKSALREAGFEARPDAQPAGAITPEDQLFTDVVGWCVEGFGDPEAERTPRPPEPERGVDPL